MGFPKAKLRAPQLQLLKEQQCPGGMAGAAPTPRNNSWRLRFQTSAKVESDAISQQILKMSISYFSWFPVLGINTTIFCFQPSLLGQSSSQTHGPKKGSEMPPQHCKPKTSPSREVPHLQPHSTGAESKSAPGIM